VKKIGPVRSARPYFLDWAAEFDAAYAHVGGSPEALTLLANGAARDLDEYSWGAFFWRDQARRAPHSTYTSTEFLRLAAKKMTERREKAGANITKKEIVSWEFKDDAGADERGGIALLTIEYPNIAYRVEWKYDKEANAYVRYQGGVAQKDADGASIMAKNVLVQFADVRVIDDVGRRKIKTVGEGAALVFLDGAIQEAVWHKPSKGERSYFTSNSKDLHVYMNRGITWIEVVPTGTTVTY
jgi:hypothetical protein